MSETQRESLRLRRPGWLGQLLWGKAHPAELDSDIAGGAVDVWRLAGASMASVEPHGDEGPIYLYECSAGVVSLVGQWLHDPHVVSFGEQESDDDHVFYREFELVRAPRTGVAFQLKVTGTPARADRIIPRNTCFLPREIWHETAFFPNATVDSLLVPKPTKRPR